MIFLLPVQQGASNQRARVVLDGSVFYVELLWNGRVGAWYLSLFDAEQRALVRSRKLVTNRPILDRVRYVQGLPPGELFALDPSETIDYAQYGELGPKLGVRLCYFDAEEMGVT
jgi:hypothetical protein